MEQGINILLIPYENIQSKDDHCSGTVSCETGAAGKTNILLVIQNFCLAT